VNETGENKMSRNTEYTAQFPAGEYYIGDLCYVMHAEWNELCGIMFAAPGNDMVEGDLSLADGRRVFLASTAYGDGTYNDNKGNHYDVDSGSIGIIAVKNIAPTEVENIDSGAVHTFTEDFGVYAFAGVFRFGDVVIDTAYEDSEEEDDDYWDDD
jgi:hypothetical protein